MKRYLAAAVTVSLIIFCLYAAGQTASNGGPMRLAWVDRAGKMISVIGQPQWFITDPILSPDGKRLAAGGRDLEKEVDHLWIYDLAEGKRKRLTSEAAQERHSTWSPKNDRLVFYSMRRNNQADLFIRNLDGSGEEPLVLTDDANEYFPTWSPDGRYVAYHTQDPKTGARDIYYVDLTGDRKPKPFVATASLEALAKFSPDGKYIVYGSDQSGTWEVYVKPFPTGEPTWKISSGGGVWPRWTDKNEIVFWTGNTLMAAKVTPGQEFHVGTPQKLFTGATAGMGSAEMKDFSPTYDVARDGTRFVVVQLVR